MEQALLLLFIFIAVAIGWRLGRWSTNKKQRVNVESLPSSYMQSLTFLISNNPDQAIDQLINEFAVNEDTFDTHIALGNVSRKRGELERAIKIHQNLLSRPTLSNDHHSTAHFELARDYLQAGLLDRAETLLLELIEKSTTYRQEARMLLMGLYENEREWRCAIDIAKALLPRRLLRQRNETELKVSVQLAHYYCELADEHIAVAGFDAAKAYAHKAAAVNKASLRANYLFVKIAAKTDDRSTLLRLSPLILQKNSKLLFEAIWLIDEIVKGQPEQFVKQYIERLYSETSSTAVLAYVFLHCSDEDKRHHNQHLEKQLQAKPSVKAMAFWLKHSDFVQQLPNEAKNTLLGFFGSLQRTYKHHQCHHCGFQSVNFFWHCPTCKAWESIDIKAGDEIE